MELKVPSLGESITEGDISRWLKADGERVLARQPVVELETDKASVEIAAEVSGILRHARPAGTTVTVGEVIGRIEEGVLPESAAPGPGPAAVPQPAVAQAPRPAAGPSAPPAAGPAPRPAAAPSAPPAAGPTRPRGDRPRSPDAPGTRRERMSRLRRSIAERLVEAQRTAAILTTFNEVDMTHAIALRKQNQDWFLRRHGVKLGYMSLFGRACIAALRELPLLNASIDGDEILYHDQVQLGIAVQTPRGLVVPVVRGAEALSLGQLETEIQRLASLARDGSLALADLQGGTFTISNGGIYGSLLSTPILNPPQSGILGMHAIQQRPVVLPDGSIVARPMMYVALSYDHRIVDGEQAVTFLVKVKQRLEAPESMLLV